MLVCIGENDAVTVAPEGRRKPVLGSGPPAFRTAYDYDGIGLQNLADGFCEIPAKIDPNAGFYRLLSRHGEELLFRELHRHLRRLELQRIRNHLGDVDCNASAQAAGQSAGNI